MHPVSQIRRDSARPPISFSWINALYVELRCQIPFGNKVVQQLNCEGDDYLIMTVRNYEDTAARDDQLEKIQDMACEA